MHHCDNGHQHVFAGRFATALPPPNALTICGRLGCVGSAGAAAALGALSYQASSLACAENPGGCG